jgi:hypothetical protein
LTRFSEFLKPGGQLGLIFANDFFCEFLDQEFSKDEEWKSYFEVSY